MLPSENQSAAFAKEVDELKRYFQGIQQERDSQPPQYVYHYTSLRNLHSILESKTIRLYDLMDMKDQQEFLHPLRMISESMKPYWNQLLTKTTSFFQRTRRLELGERWHAFVACFCEALDEHMWNDYADGGQGVAIRFQLPALCSNHAVYPMTYDDAWFMGMLRRSHENVVSRRWPYNFSFEKGNALSWEYCEQLLNFLFRIKRECFRREKEWRALILMGSSDWYHTDGNGRHYVTIPLVQKYVSAIVLGPRSLQSETEVRSGLNASPFNEAEVIRSICAG